MDTDADTVAFLCNVLEQKRFSNERIAALLEDRRIREADEDAYRKTMERRLQEQTVRCAVSQWLRIVYSFTFTTI